MHDLPRGKTRTRGGRARRSGACRCPKLSLFGRILFLGGLIPGILLALAGSPAPASAMATESHALSEPWELYWGEFVDPKDPPGEPDALLELPGSWNGINVEGESLPASGHASFRHRVELGDAPPDTLMLRVPMVYSAYRLYVDGERVAAVGEPAASAAEARADYGERRIRIENPGRELELVFHVSNYSSRAAGFPQPLTLATPEVVERQFGREIIGNAALAGGLILLGLTQLVLFRLRQGETMYLFFGITILAWGLQTALTGQLLVHAGWHLPIEIARPLDGFTALTAAAAYLLFLSALFPRELPMRYARWVLAPLIIYLGVTMFASELTRSLAVGWLLYFLTGMLALALLFVGRAWWRGVADAGPILLGSAVVAGSAILQILWFNELGIRNAVANTGVLAAIALHSFTLARRYARAFEESRRLESELRRANRLKDDFLANTSHELRTPLHSMIGLADSLPRNDPQQTRALELITASGHRLARLVDDILDFTRLQHDDLRIRPRPVNLAPMIHAVADSHRALIGARPLKLETDVEPGLPAVEADPDRLHQVLFNLAGNAVKHSDQGQITLRARREGETVYVEVEDEGRGIAAEDRERFLQPYEQGTESSHEGRGGVGLGLAISRQILERHGARLELTEGTRGGTLARFRVPVATRPEADHASPGDVAAVALGSPASATGPADTTPPRNDGPLILIVDDEDTAAEVLEQQLTLSGYRTARASSGQQALKAVKREQPQLVLLDVMMPDMGGLAVCRHLREEYDPAALPVVLVTARTRQEDVVEGLNAGANDYLPKPFYREEMLARVEAQLRVHENEQMRWALKEEHDHGSTTTDDPRRLLVELLNRSLRYWELETGLVRADLAEQSGLWTVTLDDSTRKTRTLDRYCSEETLPRRPRWGLVVRTARFVAARLHDPARARELEEGAERLESLMAIYTERRATRDTP